MIRLSYLNHIIGYYDSKDYGKNMDMDPNLRIETIIGIPGFYLEPRVYRQRIFLNSILPDAIYSSHAEVRVSKISPPYVRQYG